MTKQTVVVALGGNALLRRGEPLEADVQRRNIETAVKNNSEKAKKYNGGVVPGKGPQGGLLALQSFEKRNRKFR